jgi:CHRD domain
MPGKTALVSLAVVVFAFTACGSSKKKSTTPASSGATSAKATVQPRTYRVKLAGANEVPKGAPNGSGTAVISIRASSNELCWKFTNLKNVTAPTAAHVHKGSAGTPGPIVVPFDSKYKPSGCMPTAATTLSQIEAGPKGFYVNIHNLKYPGGAVRAQL